MYISKADAFAWFSFFAELPEDEPLLPRRSSSSPASRRSPWRRCLRSSAPRRRGSRR